MESRTHGMDHLEKLSSALDDLRKTETVCDFMIKVGEESFPVHRNVLIAASDYFRAMLSHDTKERQEGVVDMKEVEPAAVKLCIKFIYTGATTVTMETVENLLPAAGIMQLNALSENCLGILEENLKAKNCISVLKLARTHSFADLEVKALELFRENYNFEDFGDFAELEKEGLVERISDFNSRNELAWEVIINWIKLNVEERSKDILEFVKLLDWESSPSAELLEILWSEPIFTDSQECKKFLFCHLFMDSEKLRQTLTVENCFIIERLSTEFEFLTKQAMNAIDTFMKVNLSLISKKKAFKSLSGKTILSLFEDRTINCLCDESSRWEAMVSWVDADSNRTNCFPKLIQSIDFHRLSKIFLSTVVKNASLFNTSFACHKIFFDHVIKKGNTHERSHISFLYPDGSIFALNLLNKEWQRLPSVSENKTFQVIFSLHGQLCVIEDANFGYLGSNWILRSTLRHVPRENVQVSVAGNYIFLIAEEEMHIYNSLTNTWSEGFSGCDFEEFIVTARGPSVYVGSTSNGARYFNIGSQYWSEKIKAQKITKNASTTFHQGRLYVVGVDTGILLNRKFVGVLRYGNGSWENMHDLPVEITSKSWLFSTGQRLLLYSLRTLYAYDDMCDSWAIFMKIPQCTKGGIGDQKCMDPVSACSFSGILGSVNMQ
uniref:uncharacterized protein LOC120333292 n=1 Tax=Styela clava TaxID=7725 RepID=UPI00193AA1DA|nr:uncharacterized protein LOC120333292 [Styela clava]